MMRYRALSISGCGVPILRDVDLDLPERGTVVVLGPSGCGKTTLLRATIREDEEDPDLCVRGTIELDGVDVRAATQSITALRQRVGLIPQRPVAFPGTARQNVLFALECTTRLSRRERQACADRALAEASLEPEHHGSPADCLSGGQLKRLSIARTIALQPRVLLMDEPSNGLDPLSVARLERLISDLARERLVVVVTHDVAMARRVADLVHVVWPFEGGSRIVEGGRASRVLTDPVQPETRLFVETADRGAAGLARYEDRLTDVPAQECHKRTIELASNS